MKVMAILWVLFTAISANALSQESMNINFEQGLEPAIADYNVLEKSLIRRVAKKLAYNGFPIEKLTRVHLKQRIDSDRAYYTKNEIVFIINPAIFKAGSNMSTVEAITLTWEDPTTIYNADGSMEFEVGNHIAAENLKLTLYGLAAEYTDQVVIENQQLILDKINALFITCVCEDIKQLTAKGLAELAINHSISITESLDNAGEYQVGISMIGHGVFDDKHFNEIDTIYSLKVDLNKNSVLLLDRFYPSFFPTPSVRPNGLINWPA